MPKGPPASIWLLARPCCLIVFFIFGVRDFEKCTPTFCPKGKTEHTTPEVRSSHVSKTSSKSRSIGKMHVDLYFILVYRMRYWSYYKNNTVVWTLGVDHLKKQRSQEISKLIFRISKPKWVKTEVVVK